MAANYRPGVYTGSDGMKRSIHAETSSNRSTQSGDESVENEVDGLVDRSLLPLSQHKSSQPRRRHVKSGADRKPRNDYSMETRLLAVERFIRGEWTDRDGIQEMGIAATSWKNWKRAYHREKEILNQFPFLSKRKRIRSSADGHVSLSAPRSRGERMEREAYGDADYLPNQEWMSGDEDGNRQNPGDRGEAVGYHHPPDWGRHGKEWYEGTSESSQCMPDHTSQHMLSHQGQNMPCGPQLEGNQAGFAVLAAGLVQNGPRSTDAGQLPQGAIEARFQRFFDNSGPLAFIVLETPNSQDRQLDSISEITGLKGWLMPLAKFDVLVKAEAVSQVYGSDAAPHQF
eukprot:Selendium_serpulae@DN6284_c2_g5_i1.p1